MRRICLALLLLLLLTGCSTQPSISQPETAPPAAEETTAEPTGSDITETQTEAAPETPAETEAPTEAAPPAQLEPAGDIEKNAYRFIRDTLVPEYGLSDTAFFDMIDWDISQAVQPPAETQGIISAYLQDFTGDGTEELLIIRESGFDFFFAVYTAAGDSFTFLDEINFASYSEIRDTTPVVTVQDNHILVRENYAAVPGFSSYGTCIRAYHVTDAGIEQSAEAIGFRSPGIICFTINGETTYTEETEDIIDYSAMCDTIADTFTAAGIRCGEIQCGWGYGFQYGIEIAFPDEISIFSLDYVQDSGTFFLDDTALRERLYME